MRQDVFSMVRYRIDYGTRLYIFKKTHETNKLKRNKNNGKMLCTEVCSVHFLWVH